MEAVYSSETFVYAYKVHDITTRKKAENLHFNNYFFPICCKQDNEQMNLYFL